MPFGCKGGGFSISAHKNNGRSKSSNLTMILLSECMGQVGVDLRVGKVEADFEVRVTRPTR